jgi:hypothetical protein
MRPFVIRKTWFLTLALLKLRTTYTFNINLIRHETGLHPEQHKNVERQKLMLHT